MKSLSSRGTKLRKIYFWRNSTTNLFVSLHQLEISYSSYMCMTSKGINSKGAYYYSTSPRLSEAH